MTVRIVHPVADRPEQARVVFRKDNGEWKGTRINATEKTRKVSTVRYKMHRDDLAAFLANLNTNRAAEFLLSTPGYYLWGTTETSAYVYLLRYSKPVRAADFHFFVDVEYLYSRVVP